MKMDCNMIYKWYGSLSFDYSFSNNSK